MTFVAPDMAPASPEIFVLIATCVVLVVDVLLPTRTRTVTFHLAQGTVVVAAVLCLVVYPAVEVVTFDGTYVGDPMGSLLKVFILLVTYFALFYMRAYLSERGLLKGEYFTLTLFAALGMMVLVSARSFLTVYLGLELLSLSLYAMVALNRDSLVASEAAMKYFILGALASGMLLYGVSLIYGATGSLVLTDVRDAIADAGTSNVVLVLGLVFVMVGIAFKLGAVPFHMWVPHVYEGAATPVTLFIGSAPKIAAFGMVMRLLVDGLEVLHADWQQMLVILAVLSMAVGNVIAISQTNIKRMLAYSTIAHAGFLFLGVIVGNPAGYAASMFYIIVYTLMVVGASGMIVALGRDGFESDRLDDFRGLARRSPWCALLMLILMLSMAGVPPLAGFWAKWSVLRELVAAGMTWLAVVAVLFSVIGLFYYLRVVRLMYFDEPESDERISAPSDVRVMISANALGGQAGAFLGRFPFR
jgi:NADH-quinone oxidoreductase subunit N